jgi:hypothetical protein
MVQKRRTGRASTKASIGEEVAHLRGLDLVGLRSRWQSVFQRPPPDHLPRHLLFAIIAYRIQVDRLGGLDHETKQVLGSGLIDQSQKMTVAAMQMADMKVWAHRS